MKQDWKTAIVDGVEYKYSSDWIHSLESEEHWKAYWQQISLILKDTKPGESILEIGPGSGFVSNYLRSKGYQVTTLDIDEDKSPDIVANIVQYPFPHTYDHILAFEVFEHVPFETFTGLLPRLRKAALKNIFLSVPRNYKIWFHMDLITPYFRKMSFTLKTKRRKIIADRHFWELDFRNLTLSSLIRTFEEAGFKITTIKKVKLMVFIQLKP